MKRLIKSLALLVAFVASSTATTASAQTATPVDRQAEAQTFNIEYRAPIETQVRVRIAPGLDIDPQLEPILAQCGFAYGPYSITQPLYERAAREAAEGHRDWGPCGRNLIAKVDDYTGKESTIGFVISDVPGGYENCVLRKITNRGNNRDRCTYYARSAADVGLGQFTDVDRATGGDTAVADIAGALLVGTVNNLTGVGAQRLFGSNCSGSRCGSGGGNVFNVSASAAGGDGGNAAAGSSSSANLTTSGSGGCPATGCTGQPLNPNPH